MSKKLIIEIVSFIIFVLIVGGLFLFVGNRNKEKPSNTPTQTQTTKENTKKDTSGKKDSVTSADPAAFEKEVTYSGNLKGLFCKPEGVNLSAVLYSHGGKGGSQIGGDPEGTCRELAKNGIVGFSPIRSADTSANEKELQDAFDYLKGQDFVDENSIGMMGFSRGVTLTYNLAVDNASEVQGMILASGGKASSMNNNYKDAGKLDFPILLMVAENDTPAQMNGNQNMVEVLKEVESLMKSAGATVSLTIYPPYEKDHGHKMFFEIGEYFTDVVEYSKNNL